MFSIINNTITITQGDSGDFGITVYDPNERDENNKPAEYQLQPGDRVILSVRPDKKDSGYLFQIEGPEFKILPEHTKNARLSNKYEYDVELRFANGIDTHTIIDRSPFIIKEGITND